ncbi:serine/threonine-protein kinase [Dokdonella sp.]|uniref:serine/threonine-protein kinase n=1 Tax=Dokdonella sp. TaxID=2291710 RepID=UPI001B13E333|nr:serine/threonine-protein kinase [Dokdonella sp.]MBO9662200.1 tetratricopeptide repeat protein [Dokdonella sp.]
MESSPADWQRREDLLDRLLDLPERDRAAFVEEVARADAEDAAALRGWLAGIERSTDYLVPQAASDPIGHDGEIVGNWRVLRLLGRGGMGEVWLGERADGLFAKQVAIKFIRDDRPLLARHIESERRVLAGLHHPGIVRLLDAGSLVDGHPYLVTDYIDGVALDAWLERDEPALATRIDLFRQVAAAVAYAHERLVVHRDIKPANILVDADARAHLLDFGIARALAADADTAQATQIALTPEFAAPELIVANTASVRSDVYALGGLLYFLLCGRPPLSLRGLSLGAMVEKIRLEPPRAPSELAAATPLRAEPAHLAADLDAIALKALSKEASARYGTVEALLADVEAALERRPISARAPDAFDRLRRYLHRHRVGVGVAAVVALSLLAGMAGTLWQAHEAHRQRDRAEAEAARATAQAQAAGAVRDFLVGVFESANPEVTLGKPPSALELVDIGVRRAEADLKQQPDMQAQLFEALGRTYIGLGEYDKAAALLQRGYEIAVAAFGKDSPLAVTLATGYAGAIGHGDGPQDAAFAMLEPIVQRDSHASPEAAQQTAVAAYQLATLHKRLGHLDQAEANFRRSVERLRELGAPAESELAEALHQFAGLDEARGRRGEAIERLQQAIAIRERSALGPSTDVNLMRVELANLLGGAGRNDDAVAILREVVDSNRAIYGEAHPRYLESANWLARALVRKPAYAEADAILEQALATSRSHYGEDSETTAQAEVALAASKLAQGQLDAAIEFGERVRRYAVAHGGEDSYRAIVTTQNLARLRLANGEYDQAEKIARSVLAALERIGSKSTNDALELLGNVRQYKGDAEGARAYHRQALEVLERNGDQSSFDVQLLKAELAEDERDLGDLDAARRHARDALDGLVSLDQASNDRMIAFVRYLLAQFDALEGRCTAPADVEATIAHNQGPTLARVVQWRVAYARLILGLCRRQQSGADAGAAALIAENAKVLRESPLVDPHVKRLVEAAARNH